MTLPGNQSNHSKTNQVHNSSTLDVRSGSPNVSPDSSPRPPSRNQHKRDSSASPKDSNQNEKVDQTEVTSTLKAEQTSVGELCRSGSQEPIKERRTSEKTKKKTPWYSALYPTYKSRSDDFKRIFKDIPGEERLVVDYSCAIQRDILAHGRLYISQNYLCFYANIFRWETQVILPLKDVTAISKEKTAIVIPNAILVHTENEKHFFTSFGARDKAYVMLFRVWQSALIDQPLSTNDLFQWVRSCYGDELGLSDEDDCNASIHPDDDKHLKSESYSEESLSMSVAESKGSVGGESGGSETGSGAGSGAGSGTGSGAGSGAGGAVCIAGSGAGGSSLQQQVSSHSLSPPQGPLPRSPSDTLPTDFSEDSSPSESESEKQGEVVECPSVHEGKLVLHMQVAIHVDQLFTHLFTNSKFFSDLHENRKTTELKQSPWVMNPCTNQKGRTVSLTVTLGPSVGPKQAQVTESQKMLPCSKPGEIYAIEIETSNAGVPYADSFYIATHYCLTRGADPNTSTIAVHCQIKYRKSVWSIVKNFIEKNCWSGLEDYYSSLVKALEEECERTRRAMAAGVGQRKLRRRRVSPTECPVDPLVVPLQPPPYRASLAPPPPLRPIVQPLPATADPLAWLVFLTLLCLLVVNAALYYKLWGLEQASAKHQGLDLHLLSLHSPQNENDWKSLLQKQERLHSAEVERWLRILKAAVHLLHQVEESLTALQNSIQGLVSENLYSRFTDGADSATPPTRPEDEL